MLIDTVFVPTCTGILLGISLKPVSAFGEGGVLPTQAAQLHSRAKGLWLRAKDVGLSPLPTRTSGGFLSCVHSSARSGRKSKISGPDPLED